MVTRGEGLALSQAFRNQLSKHRYAAAIFIVIVFSIAVFVVDMAITFLIEVYFPGLASYTLYIHEISHALVGVFGLYILYRLIASIINLQAARQHEEGEAEAKKLILRVLFFFAAIFIALLSLGISLSGALAGGAIGGVVLGLAAQTVVTGILSGVLVSSSKTLLPGDIVLLKASYWGSVDILIRIVRVNTLYTEAMTQYGNLVRFPNPLVLNYAVITYLKKGDKISFPLQVVINADVSMEQLQKAVERDLNGEFEKRKLQHPEIIFLSRAGATNTFTVSMTLDTFSEINTVMGIVNNAFDRHYWKLKAKNN
jgi:small-conductance mechanosensitive channel